MYDDFAAAMRQAALLTRTGEVTQATQLIRDTLAGRATSGFAGARPPEVPLPAPQQPQLALIDRDAESREPSDQAAPAASQRLRKPLGQVLQALRGARVWPVKPGARARHIRAPAFPPLPEGAQFLARSFACAAGSRGYKLYVPASAHGQPRGLIVMLHGCKQNPDDFAVGTNMNAVAETHGLLVAYPAQTGAANASACWNWFSPADQKRDAGEPAIIAGLTRDLIAEFALSRARIFVAGLSAGGAMAAIMGEAYPDLYCAIGIHSGLATGLASDVMTAFAAMRGDAGLASGQPRDSTALRTIVFHGSADTMVHPANASRIVAAASVQPGQAQTRHDGTAAGRSFERSVSCARDGTPMLESWLIKGAGHAWSGGQAGGSYTDRKGPDASAQMVRFFLEGPQAGGPT